MSIAASTKPLLAVPANIITDALGGDHFLHPDFAHYADDAVIQNLSATNKHYRDGFANIISAVGVVDPTVTESKRFLDLAKRADTWLAASAERGTSATTMAKNELTRINAEIETTLRIVDGKYDVEVRSHYKSLKPNERIANAMAAVKANKTETLAAILVGPAELSGLNDEQQQLIRSEHERVNASKLVGRRKAYEKAMAINARAFDEAMIQTSKIFPKSVVAEITARTNEARAAKDAI